ncbi:hypothetical protein KC950_01020 [Candidatus Saccharibacteria bacterium]|nr:hypothetical protein [Candidatus Saccharibacteria bacterium]
MLRVRNIRGDTIVEVMIALAVLGFIIVGAYSIASRSLNATRIAQERGEATKIAEGQLEAIRDYFRTDRTKDEIKHDGYLGIANNDTATEFSLPASESGFCVVYTPGPSGGVNSSNISGPIGTTKPECTFSNLYNVYINTSYVVYQADDGGGTVDLRRLTYSVNVSWDRAGGGGRETLTIQDRFNYGG